MKADYLSYQRATNRTLLGMVIQLALGLLLLFFGIYGRDHAAITAAGFVLLGVPVWLTLAIIYDLHRRERIEAVEAEAFAASDAATSSVFEENEGEHKVAARRLKMMYRLLLPAVSIAVGTALVTFGIWRFRSGRELLAFDPPIDHRGWALAAGLAVAFVGFLFARYMAGMAKQKVWANLRGGSGFAVGSALMGLTLVIAYFIDIVGPDSVLRYLRVAFPAVLVILGIEVFVNFVLDVYRPRKPGEYPRPAFESRMLGFAAAPDKLAESIGDAINYQFGYDVSSSWFYQLMSRSVFRVMLPLAIVVLWGMSSLAVIRPHERGLVLRFGEYKRVVEPGLNLKWPWPIETVEIPIYTRKDIQGRPEFVSRTVTGIRTLDLGKHPQSGTGPILWTNEHLGGEEVLFPVQPDRRATQRPRRGTDQPEESDGGSDLALLAVEIPLHYSIEDVKAYESLAPEHMRDDLLKAVAQRAVMQYLATLTVTDLLGAKRNELQPELRRRVESEFAKLRADGSGNSPIRILYVGIHGVHPPQKNDTAKSFEKVVHAEQKYRANIKAAEAEAIRILTAVVGSVELAQKIASEIDTLDSMLQSRAAENQEAIVEQRLKIRTMIENAGGGAAATILEASAERWRRHMGERARLASYQGQLGTYRAAPQVYRASLYLDAMKYAIADSRLYIIDSSTRLHSKLNLEDRESVSDIFSSQNAPE
jgi:modulator of FtsH protease HflK